MIIGERAVARSEIERESQRDCERVRVRVIN